MHTIESAPRSVVPVHASYQKLRSALVLTWSSVTCRLPSMQSRFLITVLPLGDATGETKAHRMPWNCLGVSSQAVASFLDRYRIPWPVYIYIYIFICLSIYVWARLIYIYIYIYICVIPKHGYYMDILWASYKQRHCME